MTGKAVMVKYGENRAPVFARVELCGRAKSNVAATPPDR
jgi:hypothetical protein